MVTISSIADLLNYWYDFGVFTYLLPFLLVFAFVFGILSKTRIIGDNRGVHATIAAVVGGLSLVNDKVPAFFESIFPYAGIGMSVLLIALILMGLLGADDGEDWAKYVWFGIGAVSFVVVVWAAFSDYNYSFAGAGFLEDMVPVVLVLAGIVALFIWIILSSKHQPHETTSAKLKRRAEVAAARGD